MLPTPIREALFRMSQLPKVQHLEEKGEGQVRKAAYDRERRKRMLGMHASKRSAHYKRLGRLGKAATQKRAPLKLRGRK